MQLSALATLLHRDATDFMCKDAYVSDVTELNGHGLVFDKLNNGQAVMHYSRHRLMASVIRDYAHVCVNQ